MYRTSRSSSNALLVPLCWEKMSFQSRSEDVCTLSSVPERELATGIGDHHLGIYLGHSGPLSLAIPPWVGAMSTGDGFGHLWEETAPLKLRPHGAYNIISL